MNQKWYWFDPVRLTGATLEGKVNVMLIFFFPPTLPLPVKLNRKVKKTHIVIKTNTLKGTLNSFQTSLKIEILAGSRFSLNEYHHGFRSPNPGMSKNREILNPLPNTHFMANK